MQPSAAESANVAAWMCDHHVRIASCSRLSTQKIGFRPFICFQMCRLSRSTPQSAHPDLLQALPRWRVPIDPLEQLHHNRLFCWFVGLDPDDPVWQSSTSRSMRSCFQVFVQRSSLWVAPCCGLPWQWRRCLYGGGRLAGAGCRGCIPSSPVTSAPSICLGHSSGMVCRLVINLWVEMGRLPSWVQ